MLEGKMLSYGDRLVLVNYVLTSLPMFMLSFLEIPKGVRTTVPAFFGKRRRIRRNIDYLDGT
jgi:hypothetical protein